MNFGQRLERSQPGLRRAPRTKSGVASEHLAAAKVVAARVNVIEKEVTMKRVSFYAAVGLSLFPLLSNPAAAQY